MCGIWGLIFDKSNIDEKMDNVKMYMASSRISHRGPDRSDFRHIRGNSVDTMLGFHRLAIMDRSVNGDQPFVQDLHDGPAHRTIYCMVNGEIYNYSDLKQLHKLEPRSRSDCEVVPLLYIQYGFDKMIRMLSGEFAIALFDINHTDNTIQLYLARDPLGVRPLYVGTTNHSIAFSSELKGLVGITDHCSVNQLPNGTYLLFESSMNRMKTPVKYLLNTDKYFYIEPRSFVSGTQYEHMTQIRHTLENAVISRLITERPLGFLLSGGLDSSLVVSIAAKYMKTFKKQIYTFSIGIPGSTDREYAQMVADYCGTIHQHIEFSEKQFIDAIPDVIRCIESYDLTTVRASTGQYLISQYISQHTDIKVLLIGDGADELCSGYMYFHNAPNPDTSHQENIRLLEEIRYYDVLRADRGVAGNGLEARVPFLDPAFVHTYLSIDPALRIPIYHEQSGRNVEKYLLRMSFDKSITDVDYLPAEVLWRKKEAFSDGVSSREKSWFKIIQDNVEGLYSDEDLKHASTMQYNPPYTKEGLYYRELYENDFMGMAHTIPHMWLPLWCGDVKDPSARVLTNYSS